MPALPQWHHLIAWGGIFIWATLFGALWFQSALPSSACIIATGFGSGTINVGIYAAFGRLVPDRVRGRISSAWSMIQSLIYILFVLVAGWLSDRFSPVPVMMGYTLSYLLCGLMALYLFRGEAVPSS